MRANSPDSNIRAAWIGVLGVIIGVVGTGIVSFYIARNNPQIINIQPQPTGLPSPTPIPTVIGTPAIGADIAATGPLGFTVVANDISFVVDEVNAYGKTPDGLSPRSGYVYVIAKIRVVNASSFLVSAFDLSLVDDLGNLYNGFQPHIVEKFGLPIFPSLAPGESSLGTLAFEVPLVTTSTVPRIRLEPQYIPRGEPSTRLEVFLGDIEVSSP